ncbi:hypothetical protein JKP75_03450 [Blastococcus sp. TML/M2B]|uniref:hypothetical protein n=1 Tax=unclassified Blastococcus TaxID=2619396 RepID=UPI00190D8FFE|nr:MULTISPECIES: hypothetical protein [unclassified Blastococcus]MBN1091708.1 hypothetical protein [Blastococcus sp. TML/M2B]MBN1094733.1 hypothetical protein [Blastococcus sp. TML/C7B]
MRGAGVWSGVVAVLALASGCAAGADDARAVATAFEDPAGDPAQRCGLLAPASRAALESDGSASCAALIGELPLPGGDVTSVEVWGGEAQVRIGGDVVFLTETGAGWRVTAAACERRGEAPYDCEVEGP